MLKRHRAKRISLLGVDISPTSVKILEVSRSGSELCIEGYGCSPLPPNVFETNKEHLITCIKKLLIQIDSSAKIAALALPDSTVFSKTLQLVDNLHELEMEELIFLEAGKYFSYPQDKINLDFVVLGPSIKSLGMLDVLLVASKADNIKKRVDLLKNIGLEVKIVDIESYAIASVIKHSIPNDKGCERIAIIHISNESLSLFVWESGKPIYSYEQSSLENYRLEIKKKLHDFFFTFDDAFLDGIFLTGEFSELQELAQNLQEETGIVTFVANPFKHQLVSKNINLTELSKLAPLFVVAMGLVLRLGNDH